MTRTRHAAHLLGATALLALCACAGGSSSSVTGEGPSPVINPVSGTPAPPRNLILEPTSFRSGNQGRAVDETYDLSIRTLVTAREDNGAVVFRDNAASDFGTDQSMSYDRETNQFSFGIDYTTDDGTQVAMSETFGPLLLLTPKALGDLENGLNAVYMATQNYAYAVDPSFIAGDVYRADDYLSALRAVDPAGSGSGYLAAWRQTAGTSNDAALAAAITAAPEDFGVDGDALSRGLSASALIEAMGVVGGNNIERLLTQHTDATASIEAGPGFLYESNGITYIQYRIDNGETPTRFVAAGEWQADEDGEQQFGHLVFGQRTDASEMPDTGTATYKGTIYGNVARQNTVEALRGGFDMETDFASGDTSVAMDANIAYIDGEGITRYIDYAEFEGSGSIDGASFGGNMIGTLDRDVADGAETEVLDGTFEGHFFGPTAQDIGGTFEFSGSDAAAAGAFIATDPNSNDTGQ